MKPTKSNHIVLTLALLTCLSALNLQLSTVFAQGTAFTYQGRLNNNGSPANGLYDLRFIVWDALTNGNLVAGPLTNSATGVTNGLFAVTLDFGNGVFTGPARWLELDVRTNGNGAFTTLLPLQPLLPMPYAIMANTASNLLGTLPAAQLSGTAGSFSATNITFTGSITGNGGGLTNLNASQLSSGTIPLAQLSGITSNQLDTVTWQLATNLNGGNAALASNVVSGIAITNAFITNSVIAGNGAGLTNLNASQLTSGTLPLAQLPSVVVTNNANSLTLSGTFSGNGAGLTNLNYNSITNPPIIPSTANLVVTNDSRPLLLTNPANSFAGAFTGNGAGLTNLTGAQLPAGVLTNNQSGVVFSGLTTVSNLSVRATNFVNYLVVSNPPALNGSAITGLNASQLTTGTISLAQLPAAVVTNGTTGVTLTGTFTGAFGGSGAGLTNVPGSLVWQNVTGTSQQAQPNTGYLANSIAQVTITLPTAPNVGDIIGVSGAGSGGWRITQNAGQSILAQQFGANCVWTNWNSLVTSWSQTTAPTADWECIASSADGTKLAAAIFYYNSGIYLSTNSGATWSEVPYSGDAYYSISSSSDGTKLVAVGEDSLLHVTTNSFVWEFLADPSTNSLFEWMSVACSADGTKVAAVDRFGGIFTSTNYGFNWTMTSAHSTNGWFCIASSADGTMLAAGDELGSGGIWTSTNSGGTWLQTSAPQCGWRSIASSADGTKLAAVDWDNRVWTSASAGGTWMQTSAPTNLPWYCIASSADGTKLAAGSWNTIYFSTNSGATWTSTCAPGSAACIASSADGTKLAAVVYGAGIYTAQATIQTTTTPGAAGYLTGGQNSAIELQYIGNGQWQPLNYIGTISSDNSTNSGVTLAGTFSGVFNGNGAGLTNLITPTIANYLLSYSTTTQAVATASTFQDITNNVDAQISGWLHTAGTTSFTNAQTGLYLVEYTAIATVISSTATTISLRAVLNGTEIADSQSTALANTANQTVPISKSFIANFNTGDVLKFQFTGSGTIGRIVSNTGLGTTRPSFSCTIIRLQ